MPRRDKTGPMGNGAMEGRGLGPCADTNSATYEAGYARGVGYSRGQGFGRGAGMRCRPGMGRGYSLGYDNNQMPDTTENDLLKEEIQMLRNRLQDIEEQLTDK